MHDPDPNQTPTQRLDKWLWAARFFKTRSAAASAVSGGKVQVGGERVKPARNIRAGARIRIRKGSLEWDIVVLGLSTRRGPAPEARALYEETPESVERRRVEVGRRRSEGERAPRVGRPSKKERRDLARLKRE